MMAAMKRWITVVALMSLLSAPVFGQSRTDEDYEQLIHRLEIGMSALRELGRPDDLEVLKRITDEVRAERREAAGAKDEDAEILEVRRRLRVMRHAVEAFVEAGNQEQAEAVERAMHARELAIEGRRDDEARRIREAAPHQGQLAKLLGMAAEIHAEQGQTDRADTLASLSTLFAEQWQRRQSSQGAVEPRSEDFPLRDAEDRKARLQILQGVLETLREAEEPEAAELIGKFIRFGQLQLSNAPRETLSEQVIEMSRYAREQLDREQHLMDLVIELVERSVSLNHGMGRPDRAAACQMLALFYESRERERERQNEMRRIEERIEALRSHLSEIVTEMKHLREDR